MGGPTILRLLPAVILLVLYPKPKVQTNWVQPRPSLAPPPPPNIQPLCAPQYALVNSACSSLPYTWVPPPSPPSPPVPPSPPSPPALSGYPHHETFEQENCCRWLREIDNVCVCELLVHLPPALARPMHNYTVVVDEACSVTFQCGSRLVQF